jgi:REP element-mobilizing transposase RayT
MGLEESCSCQVRRTPDHIHAFNAAMEDAPQYKEVWVLLQDTHRGCDSVNCHEGGMLALALNRLKMPESFQNLLLFITKNKSNRVIASYALTGKYSPMC